MKFRRVILTQTSNAFTVELHTKENGECVFVSVSHCAFLIKDDRASSWDLQSDMPRMLCTLWIYRKRKRALRIGSDAVSSIGWRPVIVGFQRMEKWSGSGSIKMRQVFARSGTDSADICSQECFIKFLRNMDRLTTLSKLSWSSPHENDNMEMWHWEVYTTT